MDNAAFLKALTDIPHRAAGSAGEAETLALLESQLRDMGVDPVRHQFNAPRTYIPMIWWISGLLALALLWPNWTSLVGAAAVFWGACLYFDWRPSFLTRLPPQVQATNLWAGKGEGQKRLILMAHHDSAPISHAYKKGQVEYFRQSLILAISIMGLCVTVAASRVLGWSGMWAQITAWVLSLALLAQALMASIDFWRFGYSNAANDNGTGVATVLSAAEKLWADMPQGWRVEVLLTGAEEAGMIGALKWMQSQGAALDPENTYVINVDTVGAGELHFVARTGTLTTLVYDNVLTRLTEALGLRKAEHRVADFDSVWFARRGIPAITLGSYDENGLMPHIHRPEDRLENVDMACVEKAADFALKLARKLVS